MSAVVAGISAYAAPELHLAYPARDTVAFEKALRLGAAGDPLIERPDITLFAAGPGTPEGTLPPTKANLKAAFDHIQAQKPTTDDILVVYLARHGIALALDNSTYCYLTTEANSADAATLASDSTLRGATTVTSVELADWINRIGAAYRVLVLDTCVAGAAGKEFTAKRAVLGDQIRAMDRFKDTTGFHVLMGCAADKVSYEASKYGQGLLTYALLHGMKGPALREGSWIDVKTLFEYAEENVPRLAGDIGGIQQPRYQKPDAGSFDIGRLSESDQAGIPLTAARPQVLRPRLSNKADGVDNLDMESLLRQRLLDTTTLGVRGGVGTGSTAPFVYVDADQLTGAIQPVGQYTESAGGVVTVTLTLLRNRSRVGSAVTVTGKAATELDRSALADRIAAALTEAVMHNP